MSRELCRRCGVRLDRVLLDAGEHVHPRCGPRGFGDEAAERQALRALAAAFPGARVVSRNDRRGRDRAQTPRGTGRP